MRFLSNVAWGGIFGSLWFKIGLGVVALLALVWSVNTGISRVKNAIELSYNSGYKAGVNDEAKAWREAQAAAYQKELETMAQNVERQNSAVMGYLDEIASREPQIVRVKERTVHYAQSEAGNIACLDTDGVRLWQEHRTATLGDSGQGDTEASPAVR